MKSLSSGPEKNNLTKANIMAITILTVGRRSNDEYTLIFEDYIKRIERFEKINVKYVKDYGNLKDDAVIVRRESEEIIARMKDASYSVLLDRRGRTATDAEFKEFIEKKEIMFIIGGINGVNEAVEKAADVSISFSKLTFPHRLARVILAEQIYRAYTIKNNMRYHR